MTPLRAGDLGGSRRSHPGGLGARTSLPRRPTGILLAGVVVAISAAAIVAGDRPPPTESPGAELAQRLATAVEPARFALTYRRGGTRVLDCVLPDTEYSAEVDAKGGRMAIRSEGPDATVTVVRAGDDIYLHRSLVGNPPSARAWLRIARPADAGSAALLRRVLGADLARDVGGDRLPASGRAVAVEALGVAASVERLGDATVAGAPVERFRITVDPPRFRQAARAPGADPPSDQELVPVFDLWLDRMADVVKVAISSVQAGGGSAAPEVGWSIEYRRLEALDIAVPPPNEVADIAQVDAAQISPDPSACRLPS